MQTWAPSRKSGNQKSRSTSAASVVARTAIRSVSVTRPEVRAIVALLFVATGVFATEPVRNDRVEAALYFAEGRRADVLGQSEAAYEAYARALTFDPSSRQAALAKAATLMDLGRSSEALQILQSLPSSSLDEAERSTLLCLALVAEKHGEAAVLAQRDALTALAGWNVEDPERIARVAEGLLRSATLLSRKTQREVAASILPAFIRAADLDPGVSGITLRAAEIALAADDLPTALRYLGNFQEDNGDESSILEQLAAVQILSGLSDQADETLRKIDVVKPGRANLYPVLANLYEELNLSARAEIYRVLALHAAHPPALTDFLRLALLQLKQNQPRRAFRTIEQGAGFYPDSIQLLLVQGLAEKAQNRMADAVATFAKVERLAQNRPEVLDAGFYYEYGSASEQAGLPTRSEAALKRALQLNPGHHPSLNYLGYMWAERGRNLREALGMIEKALELSPGNPAYLDSQAWALYRLGHPHEAKPLMEEALRLVPDDPTLLEHSGDVYASLGDTQRALDAYYKALVVGGPVVPLRDKIRANSRKISRR
ncbi:hypothetical protein EBX31_06360 [bacterium]|nr:hypothetical protein [bacterium]